tara:strand:- start:560 stop:952 length:393 start_codon:yes stop_codon:yes gene_type:complete
VCDVEVGDFTLRVDEPESVPGGTNTGPQPTDLLLASVASCFTLALSFAASKRSIDLEHLDVDVIGMYDGPSFREIRIMAYVGCDVAELDRLVATAERVCYVTNTLRNGVDLVIEATATERSAAGRGLNRT